MTADVVVLGSGGAGLTAALAAHEAGARVAVLEKADQIGGSTAWSGGRLWIPNNPHMAGVGVADSRERALAYIMALSNGLIDPAMAEAYVDAGPAMVRFLEERAAVPLAAVTGKPDYHAELPGGSAEGGRTLECPVFAFAELGPWAERVATSPFYVNARMTVSERHMGGASLARPSDAELERRQARDERGSGQALVGRLLRACLDRGILPETRARGRELVLRDGRVAGVRVETEAGVREVAADAVILATGGFEWSAEDVRHFLRGPMTHPISVPTNTGDGLRMALKAGAMPGNMKEAWWMPATPVPESVNRLGWAYISGERALPGAIMVNREGRRFTNEAVDYNSIGAAFHAMDVTRFRYGNLPCWMIFDHGYVERYGFGQWSAPGAAPDWVTRAPTLAGLAERLGIDPAGLKATIQRWNGHAAALHDPDFHRGENAFDRFWGDPRHKGGPEATLGPLAAPPFYAVELFSGALGTKGGPRIDADARVLDVDGAPVPGLYAAGNVAASPFGMSYGGAGGTIGPAMVFGWLAGRHAATWREETAWAASTGASR